jgi:hypothetical protein
VAWIIEPKQQSESQQPDSKRSGCFAFVRQMSETAAEFVKSLIQRLTSDRAKIGAQEVYVVFFGK